MDIDLVKLQFNDKDRFVSFLKEMQQDGGEEDLFDLESITADYDTFLKKEIDNENGVGLQDGWVPSTMYMMEVGDIFVGWISLRHRLTPTLESFGGHIGYGVSPKHQKNGYCTMAVKKSIEIAAKMGVERLLITCDDDNVGSIKVIESNKGVLQDKIQNEGRDTLTRRYWIEVA